MRNESSYDLANHINKMAVSTALAGVRQRNLFGIYMENFSTYRDAISEAEKAQGTAARKMQAYNESVAYSINQLSAAWEGFTQKLEASGAVKLFFTGLTAIIKNLDHILQQLIPLIATFNADKIVSLVKFLSPLITTPLKATRHPIDTVRKSKGDFYENMTQKMTAENTNAIEELTNATRDNTAALRGEKSRGGAGGVGHQSGTTGKGVRDKKRFNNIPTVPTDGTLSASQYTPEQIDLRVQSYDSIISDAKQNGTNEKVIKQLEDKRERLLKIKSTMTGVIPYDPNIQKAAEEEQAELEAQKKAKRKARLETGSAAGLAAGVVRFANKGSSFLDEAMGVSNVEVDTGEALAMGVAQGALTGVATAFMGPAGAVLASFVGDALSSLWKKFAHADEVARKQRVEDAKKQLEAINGIGNSVTGLIDLNKKDQALWDSDDWKQFNEQVETINEALEKSELGDKIIDLGNKTQTLSEYFEDAVRNGNKDMFARVEAERIRFEAEKTYAAGEQDRYDLLKEISENQKELAKLDDDEASKKRELNAAIKAARAEFESYSEALKKGYMQASFYSSGVGTMELYDIRNATLDRVIMQIAREWAEKSPDIFAGNQLTSDARSDIISYLREQSGYSSLFKNDTKNVRDMLNAEKAVENLRTTLGMSQKQLKEFANSKDLSEIADKFGATGDALYKIIDQVNLVDEDGISTIAHAMNMTVEQFREANSEGAFDWLTTDVAIGGLDKLNEKLATFNELLLAASENSLFSQENINKIVSQYPTLLKKIDEETGKISVSMDNVQENLVDILAGGESLRKVYAGFFSRDIATSAEKWDVFISSIREDIEKDSALDGFRDEIFKQINYSGFLKVYEEHKDELESYNQSFIEYAKSLFSTDVFDTQQEILTKYATSTLETEISNLESIRDSLDDINKQREKEIELIKAKEALENASKEKKRVYRAGVGFVYTTDQEAVKSAQEKVDELERQRDKDDIQYQIDSLQQQKEILENIKDNEQLKALQETAKDTLDALGVNGALVTAILSGSKEEFNAAIKSGLDKEIGENAADVNNAIASKKKEAYYRAKAELDAFQRGKKFTGKFEQTTDANGNKVNDYSKPIFEDMSDEDLERYGGMVPGQLKKYQNSPFYSVGAEEEERLAKELLGAGETWKAEDESAQIEDIEKILKEKENITGNRFVVQNPGDFSDKYGILEIGYQTTGNSIWRKGTKQSELSYAIQNPDGTMGDWKNFTKPISENLENEEIKGKPVIVSNTHGSPNLLIYKDQNDQFWSLYGVLPYDKGLTSAGQVAGTSGTWWISPEEVKSHEANVRDRVYASGTLSAPGGQSLINENGLESIITPSGTITSLPAKSGIIPADLTRNLWALGEVAPNLIARLGGNSLQTNNSNSSTDNSINIQNLDATFNTQSDFDGHRFLTDLRNQVILTANNH